MSKRVSIVLPDEKPLVLKRGGNAPRAKLKSSIKGGPSCQSHLGPPVFVVVSPQNSGSSEASSRRTSNSSESDSESSNVGPLDVESEASAGTCALVRTGSANSANLDPTSLPIKQFLRSTVSLVRAGESFTAVKRLFYNFIKTSSGPGSLTKLADEVFPEGATRCLTQDSSASSFQLAPRENPYLSASNDTLLSSSSPQFTIPSTSQMSTSTKQSNFSFNPRKYDMSAWHSDVTPLTGYTPLTAHTPLPGHTPSQTTLLSPEEAGFQSDGSQKSYVSIQAQLKNQELAVVKSAPLSTQSSLSGTPSREQSAPEHRQGNEIEISSGQVETATLVSTPFPKILNTTPKSSPRRSPKMTPRSDALITATLEPAFVLVSSPGTHSEGDQSLQSSGSSQRSSLRSVQQYARTPTVSPRASVSSGYSQIVAEVEGKGEEPNFKMNRPENLQQRCENSSRKVSFLFALVSPEEAGTSQPAQSTDKGVEEISTCPTYQEQCKCHHCQDMRRATKRAEYFQSPAGQKQMESKLLAKNFFMDLCALSEVRKQIQADLYGTRTHPPARVSYPVSICGASRLDGGSLTLKWFTHDLDCVDHFDFFVDDKPSRSVFNTRATATVLLDVDACKTHRLRMRAVPVRGCGAQATPVDKLMSEVAAGHMRHVRQGKLFASCLRHLDQPQQRSLVDFWTDSEFLYMPTWDRPPSKKGR